MMNVELLNFLRTGIFGALSIGSNSDEVIYYIGDPENWTESTNPTIWKYGNVEIMLNFDEVLSIEVTFLDCKDNLWSTIFIRDFFVFENISIKSFEKILEKEKIDYRFYEFISKIYLLPNNVRATEENNKLASISVLDMTRLNNI